MRREEMVLKRREGRRKEGKIEGKRRERRRREEKRRNKKCWYHGVKGEGESSLLSFLGPWGPSSIPITKLLYDNIT